MEEVQPLTLEQEQLAPLVTVIIVSYRRRSVLRRCLEALEKSEDRARMQVIVLDAGNHDTTPEWDLEFSEITFLRMPRNFGATKALNIGIRSAKADLLLFLDPAISVEPGTISQLIAQQEATPDAGALCPLLVDPSGKPVPQVSALPDRDTLWKAWQDPAALVRTVPGSGPGPIVVEYPERKALLVRRVFLHGMNYFDEKYGEWGGDLELAFQIRHAGKKALILPAVKAVDHSATEAQLNWSNGQLAIIAADRLNGVANFLGKRLGFVPGLLIQIQAILVTLLRTLTFQRPGYNFTLLLSLLGGQKIDGTQGW